jgi:hypothetical protein
VNRFLEFHSLSPWRSRTRVAGMASSLPGPVGPVGGLDPVGVGEAREGLQVAGRLAVLLPPGPLARIEPAKPISSSRSKESSAYSSTEPRMRSTSSAVMALSGSRPTR